MNSSTAIPSEASLPPAPEPAAVPFFRVFFWTVRRELWENRSIYLAPFSVAALFLVGFMISMPALPARMRALSLLDAVQRQRGMVRHYDLAAALIMGAGTIVAIFYCLDALQGERRDRSILFWKSLPVSDLTAVLAKASIPLVVLQLVSFAAVVVTQLVMLLMSTAVLAASGLAAGPMWDQLSIVRSWLLLLYHLISVHALWYAPIYAWLLFVSAWSRRAAFLWAILPLFAICGLEKIAFNTTRILVQIGHRLTGGMEAVIMPGTFPMSPMNHATPGRFVESPGLWIGLAIAAALLAGAVQLRRSRPPL